MGLDLSIIIPTYNPTEKFRELINVLARQETDLKYEIIIVDDFSDSHLYQVTEQWVEECNARNNIRVIRTKKNSGPAHARNLGVQHSTGTLLFFIDNDCIVRGTDHFKKASKVIQSKPGHIIGGTIFGVGKGYIASADHFCRWITNLPGYTGRAPEPHIVTTNMFISRKLWSKVGPLNESLRSGEDVELCFEATRQKIPLWLTDELQIGHYDRESLATFFKNYYFCGTYRPSFYGKYHGWKRLLVGGPRWFRGLLIPFITTALIGRYIIGWWKIDKGVFRVLPGISIACFAMALGLAIGLPPQRNPLSNARG